MSGCVHVEDDCSNCHWGAGVKTTRGAGGKGGKRGSGDSRLRCGTLFLATKQQFEGASITEAAGDEPNPKGEEVMQCFFTIRRAKPRYKPFLLAYNALTSSLLLPLLWGRTAPC
jgi:hypothetical protein